MTSFDLANNAVAMVDWQSPHAKQQVMENIKRLTDAHDAEVRDRALEEVLAKKRDLYEIGSKESEAVQFIVNALRLKSGGL